MEGQLGKAQRGKLELLLDQVIAREAPGGEDASEDMAEDETE